jgi:hypothetical protein
MASQDPLPTSANQTASESAEQTQKVAGSSAMDTYTVSNLVSSAAHMAGDAYRAPSLWGSWSCIELWATGCSDRQW